MYHLPIDWRRAKFFIAHPSVVPVTTAYPIDISVTSSHFVAVDQITNVLMIRDWLHQAALHGRYYMFGCYEQATSLFKGIMFVFDHMADMLRFREQWALA